MLIWLTQVGLEAPPGQRQTSLQSRATLEGEADLIRHATTGQSARVRAPPSAMTDPSLVAPHMETHVSGKGHLNVTPAAPTRPWPPKHCALLDLKVKVKPDVLHGREANLLGAALQPEVESQRSSGRAASHRLCFNRPQRATRTYTL